MPPISIEADVLKTPFRIGLLDDSNWRVFLYAVGCQAQAPRRLLRPSALLATRGEREPEAMTRFAAPI